MALYNEDGLILVNSLTELTISNHPFWNWLLRGFYLQLSLKVNLQDAFASHLVKRGDIKIFTYKVRFAT